MLDNFVMVIKLKQFNGASRDTKIFKKDCVTNLLDLKAVGNSNNSRIISHHLKMYQILAFNNYKVLSMFRTILYIEREGPSVVIGYMYFVNGTLLGQIVIVLTGVNNFP